MSGQFNIGPAQGPRFRRGDEAPSESAAADHAADFDALTDLFMGEVNTPPPRPDVQPPIRRAPVLRLASEDDLSDWDDDPESSAAPTAAAAPAAIAPSPPSPSRTVATPARGGPEPRGDGAPTRPRGEQTVVECIVLGNLPVYGAAWGAQYAREVARNAGRPVAYLRLQSGYASVELVGAGEPGSTLQFTSLEDALKHAAERTCRWVLRADPGEEPFVAASPLVRVVTLLTGVDEAAVLGAYTSIKSLASELPGGAGKRDIAIRVAVMGATPQQAEPACRRLTDAARKFLGRDVHYAVCGVKVSAVRPAEVLFSGRTEMTTADVMVLLSQTIGAPGDDAAIPDMPNIPTPAASTPATGSLDELIDRLAPPEPEARSDDVSAAVEPGAARPVAPQPVPANAPAPAGGIPAGPARAANAPADAGACSEPEPVGSLALLLDDLRPVSVLCPYAPGVELAVDSAGGLHLLVRTEPDDGEDGEQRALSQLLVAGSWAEAHGSLLGPALALAGVPIPCPTTHKPVLHLFTDRPKRSRRLLETDVRIHLLARVNIGGQSGWYCTELN